MSIQVLKFGGTSLGDTRKMKNAAEIMIREQKAGHRVVAVLSAQGDTTDRLLEKAYEITDAPPERELDMLISTGEQVSVALMAMTLHSMGCPAISFNAMQVGFYTDSTFTKARIQKIHPEKTLKALANGRIVLVAGFQGMDEDMNVTTLGRGGSDTSAVALGAALNADTVNIYTDVDGVFTADPRMVPNARRLSTISYDEMLELAALGARVMHSRAVELGMRQNIPIHVRSSFTGRPGTIIKEATPEMEDILVRGCALEENEARITVRHVPDVPGVSARLFGVVADENINVDVIVQNVSLEGFTDISFTLPDSDLDKAMPIVGKIAEDIKAGEVASDTDIAKLSVVGIGMKGKHGVASRMFTALADSNINVLATTTSEIKISCLIRREDGKKAMQAVHAAFFEN